MDSNPTPLISDINYLPLGQLTRTGIAFYIGKTACQWMEGSNSFLITNSKFYKYNYILCFISSILSNKNYPFKNMDLNDELITTPIDMLAEAVRLIPREIRDTIAQLTVVAALRIPRHRAYNHRDRELGLFDDYFVR